MLTAIRRGLARFWYGPTGAPGATTMFPHEADPDHVAMIEESHRLAEETTLRLLLEDKDDDRR